MISTAFSPLYIHDARAAHEYISAITHMFTSQLFPHMSNVYLKTQYAWCTPSP